MSQEITGPENKESSPNRSLDWQEAFQAAVGVLIRSGLPVEEAESLVENSGLRGSAEGEDLPEGSLGLLDEDARRQRAVDIGEKWAHNQAIRVRNHLD